MRTYRLSGIVMLASLAAACDTKVSNPGRVEDDQLDNPVAVAAIVNGAGRDLSDGLNWVAYTGAAVAREIHPAGSTGSFGISVQQQNGKLLDDEVDTHWANAQRARWTAEQGAARMRKLPGFDFAKNKSAAQILLWVGYANRMLGENMCDAVIDGGPRAAYTAYLERAEAAFTEALAVATAVGDANLANAAKAGRASVRLLRNNPDGAVADASGIPDAFVYQMPYNAIDESQYNRIYWAVGNQPYRAHTVWNTYYEKYYATTKDPRVAWGQDPKNPTGDAAVGNLGRVPWYFEMKYQKKEAPINLSSGWEMRLIEGEAKLIAGDIPGAMALINKHRVALGLAPWPGADATEAWNGLRRERGIELWLEGRRLGDARRWAALGRPGTIDEMGGRDVCFPISRTEKETNGNLGS
jgi:hypothetical protein